MSRTDFNPKARSIFLTAVEIEDAEARDAHVRETCVGDEGLLQEVRELLAAHDTPVGILDRPAIEPGETAGLSAEHEQPGGWVGPYRLMEQIGEGGFATVYRAEQEHPVHREVAVKVLKPGMDTRRVVQQPRRHQLRERGLRHLR